MTVFVLNDNDNIISFANYETAHLRNHFTTVTVSDTDLSALFEAATVDTLDGTGDTIEAAIETPHDYLDFVTYDGEKILFDDSHSRVQQ
jgi:hypothetical protein